MAYTTDSEKVLDEIKTAGTLVNHVTHGLCLSLRTVDDKTLVYYISVIGKLECCRYDRLCRCDARQQFEGFDKFGHQVWIDKEV